MNPTTTPATGDAPVVSPPGALAVGTGAPGQTSKEAKMNQIDPIDRVNPERTSVDEVGVSTPFTESTGSTPPDTALRDHLAAAVAAYRRAVLAADPDLPAELIAGESIDEVDAAVAQVRTVIARLKDQIRTNDAQRIPPGATDRTPLDPTSLSPREKIVFGIQRTA